MGVSELLVALFGFLDTTGSVQVETLETTADSTDLRGEKILGAVFLALMPAYSVNVPNPGSKVTEGVVIVLAITLGSTGIYKDETEKKDVYRYIKDCRCTFFTKRLHWVLLSSFLLVAIFAFLGCASLNATRTGSVCGNELKKKISYCYHKRGGTVDTKHKRKKLSSFCFETLR